MELNETDGVTQPPNSLESILLKGASQLDGIQLSDEMVKSYICTAHLRIIRQLNCTIRGECEPCKHYPHYESISNIDYSTEGDNKNNKWKRLF